MSGQPAPDPDKPRLLERSTMPTESTTVVRVSCDNPDCPGNDLDPEDRLGWLFVSHEVYGEPTQQHVFCSYGCLGTAASLKPAVNPLIAEPAATRMPEAPNAT